MQTSPRPRRPRSLTLLGAGALLALAGCFDNDPGLQERLVRTQADLQEQTRKVRELETALEKARERAPAPAEAPAATSAPTPAMLTREQLEETYVAAAKAMRQQVESDLSGYKVENCALFKVDMPSVALPYTSKVALSLRSAAGQPCRLEFPVGADWSGKWTFPATGEIVATLEKAQAQAAAGASGSGAGSRAGSSAPARPAGRHGEGPANTSVETVEMTWGSNNRRAPGVAAPAPQTPRASSVPPAGNPAPAPGSGPARPAMPSERDVLIQF